MRAQATGRPTAQRPYGCGCAGQLRPSLPHAARELSEVSLDLALGLASGKLYDLRQMALHWVRAGAAVAEGVGAVFPGIDGTRWQELANKLTAYRLFASADGHLGAGTGLLDALRSISRWDAYARVWITEGLGWCCGGRNHWNLRVWPPDLPRSALIPLHTGAGLAWAQAALESRGSEGLPAAIDRFRERCREASSPGYYGAAFEALGLVAISLYPNLAQEIERALSDEEAEFFWHGVGRGSYFSPANLPPLAVARRFTVGPLTRQPSSAAGRNNSLAGFAWATTLVNIRHPAVLERSMSDLPAAAAADGFTHGVVSALMVWREVCPEDRYLEAWTGFEAARRASRWYDRVCARAGWGSLFRVRLFEE